MTLPPVLQAQLRDLVAHEGNPRAAMLESLRLVQAAEGWVSDDRIPQIAAELGVTPAELDATASFYSLIFRRPVGRTVILLCDGASCGLNGADAIRDALMSRLGIGYGQTTPDGRFTLINSACVGGCDRAPAAVIGPDRTLVGPLTADTLNAVLEEAP
ncbi:NADH-quinone oxidoreductase subunit NuoE [Rhodobacter sp. Har01]|uniref:NADH-quinone oxidoreductase subunit NuoE n=1 Tax=Rhodobacter sp. Har01 TaxID=2883999 RepID=UPI001D07FA91|nr:NADH-quinone oxidoreductase subunit NuoE [Rhodobacter sp. Har01]MCB6179922.1 NADH-quinone oxidoreductase subunit NuoE [Rhodobacter sp. Har01]